MVVWWGRVCWYGGVEYVVVWWGRVCWYGVYSVVECRVVLCGRVWSCAVIWFVMYYVVV